MGSMRQEYVKCGKAGCKSCPHGPYWYEYWREGEKVRKRYVGKNLADYKPKEDGWPWPKEWEDILCKATATLSLASAILGIPYDATKKQAYSLWAKLAMVEHPDRGGNEEKFMRLNAAWSFYRAGRGW